MRKQRITAKHSVCDRIALMIVQMDTAVHQRERKSAAVELTGTNGVEKLIVPVNDSFTALCVLEDPGLESLLDLLSLFLNHTGSFFVNDTLFLSIAQAVRYLNSLVDLRLFQVEQMLHDLISVHLS